MNLKQFINGGVPALLKHTFTLLTALGATIVAVTLLYADVRATEQKTDNNRERVEAIENQMNKMTTQQRLLLQRAEDEKDLNKEFRKETGRALNEILLRLPRTTRRDQ